jgi:mannan endo-1,4-beta-mannosidase
VRHYLLNLLTLAGTAVLLVVLTLPAERDAIRLGNSSSSTALVPRFQPARYLGVYVDPWHLADWSRQVGVKPTMVAKFEAFSKQRTVGNFLAEAARQSVPAVLVSWEPWEPVSAAFPGTVQGLPQPGYRNAEVARGAQDPYIRRFAASLARFPGRVYVRYAHEMNGFWYPWSHGPRAYVRAWRHVVALVRAEARNVRFVWSPNLNLYQAAGSWLRDARRYYPGARYVDLVGATVINFGGSKRYFPRRFVPRLDALHRTFGKSLLLPEVSTNFADRLAWLRELRHVLKRRLWIRGMAWSQLPSRAAAHGEGVGNLGWDITRDPPAAAKLRLIARVLAG